MVVAPLEQFLISELFTFLVLLTRIGSFLMVIPAIGDSYVSTRIRLLLAIAISIMLVPLLASVMPPMPPSALGLAMVVMAEILIGVFFGVIVRFLMTTMNVAGSIIANQSTLAIASIFEQSAGIQTAIVSNFFMLGSFALFFALDLHHILLLAIIQSYDAFPTGTWINTGDASHVLARTLSDIFVLSVQFAAPNIVMGLILYISAGIMGRMMPAFQVFFVLVPPQIMLSLTLIMFIIPPMMGLYGNYLEDAFLTLVARPLSSAP
jgi:flagellar biosynthetic protein FliR